MPRLMPPNRLDGKKLYEITISDRSLPHKVIAERYGISEAHVCNLRNGKTVPRMLTEYMQDLGIIGKPPHVSPTEAAIKEERAKPPIERPVKAALPVSVPKPRISFGTPPKVPAVRLKDIRKCAAPVAHEAERFFAEYDQDNCQGWEDGKCKVCKLPRTPEGQDPCISNLPGVAFACCGHGKQNGYVAFEANEHGDKVVLRGHFEENRFGHTDSHPLRKWVDAGLSPQQYRVLKMLAYGLLNKEIAFKLNCTEGTIKSHVSTILKRYIKAGAPVRFPNRGHLTVWYLSMLDETEQREMFDAVCPPNKSGLLLCPPGDKP